MNENSAKTYVGVLSVLAITLAASWIYWYEIEFTALTAVTTLVFGVLMFVAKRFPIKISERSEVDASDIVVTASVIMLGPVWAGLAAVVYALSFVRKDLLRASYVAASAVVECFVVGMVFASTSEPLLLTEQSVSTIPIVFAALVASLALTLTNNLNNAILLRVKYGQTFRETWKDLVEPYLLSDAINMVTCGLGIFAFLIYGPAAAVIVVGGSVASQVLAYKTRDQMTENRVLKARIVSLEESLNVANLTFGAMMIEEIGSKDGYTHLHAAATSVYAGDIAREMQLEESVAQRLQTAGLLHNIGMFGAPVELLTATGTPNSVAKGLISEHPILGERALASVPEFSEMASWVRWHHERPDGRGYPDRLRGPWIPLEAKILAVAQAYAALILDQPRRPGLPYTEARQELNAGAGTQFDEVVVRAMLRILDTESEGYRMADDDRFIFQAIKETERRVPKDAGESSSDGV